MKPTWIFPFSIGLFLAFYSCEREEPRRPLPDCTTGVSITQGIAGSCILRYGDWMPSPGGNCCHWSTEVRTIYFYTPTTDTEAVKIGTGNTSFYSQINTTRIAETQCDENGCYQVSLPPGQYSVFILYDGKYYCGDMGDNFLLCPVTVDSGAVTNWDLIIDQTIN